jgi:hypothetical protein
MAENDSSWSLQDDSWRKTTRHGQMVACLAGVVNCLIGLIGLICSIGSAQDNQFNQYNE